MTSDTAPSPRKRPGRFLRALSLAEAAVGGLLLAVLAALVLLQAVQRYLPTGGWVWTAELARFTFIWLTFAMAGYLAARDDHVSLKLIDVVAGPRLTRAVGIVANVTVAIVCLNLLYEAWVLVTDANQPTSPALGFPMRYFYLVPLAGLALTTVHSIVAAFRPDTGTDAPAEDGPSGDRQAGSGNREER